VKFLSTCCHAPMTETERCSNCLESCVGYVDLTGLRPDQLEESIKHYMDCTTEVFESYRAIQCGYSYALNIESAARQKQMEEVFGKLSDALVKL